MKPLVVVEGDEHGWNAVVADVASRWDVVRGFVPDPAVVCAARVDSADDAGRAVLAALAGAGLVVWATADRAIADRLCDDLRRFGEVDHRFAVAAARPQLTDEQAELLALLADGTTLGDAASALHISRRTADRRLAGARRLLGVTSTTQAVLAAQRLLA